MEKKAKPLFTQTVCILEKTSQTTAPRRHVLKKTCQGACNGDVDCPREGDFSAKVMLVVRPMCNEGTTCETGKRYTRKGLRSGTLDAQQAIP